MRSPDRHGAALPPAARVLTSSLVRRVDRALTPPVAETEPSRRVWRAMTALGSRPVTYTAVALHCCLGTARGAVRWQPLVVLATGDAARKALSLRIARPRPPEGALTSPHGPSFPSRHTAMALLAVRLISGRRTRRYDGIAAAVAVSRVVLRAHWPTDVIGGWAFTTAWLALARAATSRARTQPYG